MRTPVQEEAPTMSRNIGLCMTCNNSRTCTHERDGKRPVLYCEEFYSYALPAKEITPESILASKPYEGKPMRGEREIIGLCANCEERGSCTQAGTEGGVWHCENYC